MTDSPTEKTAQPRKSRWPKKTLIAVLLIGALLLGLPYAIGFGIKKALIAAGADDAQVEDIDFNLFRGDLKVKRLHIQVADLPEVVLKEAFVDLDWSALLKKHFVIETITITDTDIRVLINEDGSINVVGLEVLPDNETRAQAEPKHGKGIPYIEGAGVAQFDLSDINFVYVDPKLDLELQIDHLKIDHVYSWEADRISKLSFEGSLNGAPINIKAEIKAFGETRFADTQIDIDGLDINAFENSAGDALSKLAGKLSTSGQFKITYQPGNISVHKDGELTLDALDIAFSNGTLQQKHSALNGITDIDLSIPEDDTKSISADIGFKGKLGADGLQVAIADPAMTVDGSKLRWDGAFSQKGSSTDALKVSGAVNIGKTSFEMTGEQPFKAAVSEIGVKGLKLDGLNSIKIGSIHVAGIENAIPGDKPMSASMKSLQTSDFALSNLKEVTAASIKASDTRLTDTGTNIDLAIIGTTAVSKLDLSSADLISIGSVKLAEIRGIAAGKGESQVFAAKGINVDSIAVKNTDEVTINSVELVDSSTALSRLKSGKWYLLDQLGGGDTKAAPKSAKDEADKAAATGASTLPIKIRIAELKTSGDNSFHYADATVAPKADIKVVIKEFLLTDVDSHASSSTPNKFKLDARVGKYGKVNSSGSLRPLSNPPTADLKLKLDGLDLKVASPMLAGAVGYIVESGSLDLDTSFKIDPKGDMSGANNIKLTQLVLKPGDKEVMAKVNSSSPMPLDAALNLLRDDNNVIEMDIPISGNINDPSIDLSDAIGQAIGSIAGTAAMAALTTVGPAAALGPIGLIAIVGKMGVEQLAKVRLASIEYAPGSADAPAGIAKNLQDSAALLEKSEKLSLRLCPFYTLEDAQAVANAAGNGNSQRSALATHKEAVTQLAQKRAAELKEQLVSQYKLEPKRILTCTPELDDSGSGKPRVEFGL